MLMRLNPSTKEAYNKMADLGLITYNAQAGFDFLVKNGITPASRSVGDIEVALEKYVMKTEGVTKWNDKCDTTFRELATSSAFLSSKFYDQQGKIQSLENISGTLKESMKDLTDQQRSMALETLFGSDAVRGATILFNEGSQGVNKMYSEMSKVTALETANTKMNTLKGRIEQLSGAFDTMKKTIGDALAPVVSAFVAGLQKLVDGFNALPGPVQKAIAITGGIVLALTAIAFAIGAFLATIGMIVSGIGSLSIALASVGGIAGVAAGAVGFLGSAVGLLLGPVGLVAAALIGTGVVAYKAYQKATEDSIASVDRFATNNKLAQDEYQKTLANSDAATKKYMQQQTGEISSSTKKVLGEYFKLSDGIKQKLTEINLNHEVMTTEQAQKLGQQYDQLTEKIIAKVDERKQKETDRLRKLFADSYVLTSEEENKRLELLNQKYEDEKIKVAEKNQKIKEINDLAAAEHREKTQSEKIAIQALHDEMDRTAVQHMTQNQMEQKVILENMRVQASEISARQAAEVVENSAKTRDKVIEDAKKTRDEKIAEAIRQRDEMGGLNAQEADSVIAEAKRQYDSTVSTAKDKHTEIVSEAKAQAGEHANQVDWETGQIKSKYQVMKDDVVQKMKETWSGITKWWEETKTSASNTVDDIKNTVIRKFEEKKKAVTDKMKEIKSDIEDKWNTVEKFFSTINLRSIGKSIIEGLEKGLDDATGGLYSKAKEIANDIKKTISGALEINSPSKVMIPVGSAVPEGVGVGMDRGKRFALDAARNVVGTVKKQMSNMPSVFDFGFQTSHYSVPNDAVSGLTNYMQPSIPNNSATSKKVFPNKRPEEKELNLTLNMTNVLDGKELAGGTYRYTTELQDRDRQRKEQFLGR